MQKSNYKLKFLFEKLNLIIDIFGKHDENIKLITQELDVEINLLDNELIINGEEKSSKIAYKLIENLYKNANMGNLIDRNLILYTIDMVKKDLNYDFSNFTQETIVVTHRGKPIKSKTVGQAHYVNSIKKADLVFSIGPAGTGKTYLAMAMAVKAFKNKEVSRIILTRPAVEAGEKLGFLPGDLQNKVDPYLRPLYDSLHDLMGFDTYNRLIERGVIEVAPLAYMRGRTLDDAFIILDEAQNTTSEQMKMFLTRLGIGSKAVINGDITQIDLPLGIKSGLVIAEKILKNTKGISFVYLNRHDVVRHELVKSIIDAYENYYKNGDRKERDN